jgi:DNA polymerase V
MKYTLKRLDSRNGMIELHAANLAYPPIRFRENDELQVWGVVAGTVTHFDV